MAEFNQFGSIRPSQTADAKECASFEAMLAEAVDGGLTAEEQAAFDLHLLGCASCREMLADAKRGATWMEMLRQHAPQPPAGLLERIFAQTSGVGAHGAGMAVAEPMGGLGMGSTAVAGEALPAGAVSGMAALAGAARAAKTNVVPFRSRLAGQRGLRAIGHTVLQPRLAMTAAMAFFSIALTMNLTGVRVSDLRVSDLRPANLRRSVYQANAHVVRYVTNLREVYELESRVHDLQRSSESDRTAGPVAPEAGAGDGSPSKDGAAGQGGVDGSGKKGGKEPEVQPRRRTSPGTSRREPLRDDLRVLAGWNRKMRRQPALEQASLLRFGFAPMRVGSASLPALSLRAPEIDRIAPERGTV